MNRDDTIDLILAAVARCHAAEKRWRDLESDPSSSSDERAAAKLSKEAKVREFGWQWENVEKVIRHLI